MLVDSNLHLGGAPRHDSNRRVKIEIEDLDFWYDEKQVLQNINLTLYDREVTAFIGPSGCGKSTLLRCLNRTNDAITGARLAGRILLDGEDINDPDIDPPLLRRRFGWVAQRPNPFPWSIYDNVAYGPRIHGMVDTRAETDALVQECLERAGLWEEVRYRLREPGTDLSGGQQQRLCLARAISTAPEIILLDEPASALDPTATAKLEDLIVQLRERTAIVIVTHNLQQAARLAQRVAFFHLGRLVEDGDAETVLLQPEQRLTRDYVVGRMG